MANNIYGFVKQGSGWGLPNIPGLKSSIELNPMEGTGFPAEFAQYLRGTPGTISNLAGGLLDVPQAVWSKYYSSPNPGTIRLSSSPRPPGDITFTDQQGNTYKYNGGANVQGWSVSPTAYLELTSGPGLTDPSKAPPGGSSQTPESYLTSGEYRDLNFKDVPEGKSFGDYAQTTKKYDPVKGPQIDTGQGWQSFTPGQNGQSYNASGQGFSTPQIVANNQPPATPPTTPPNPYQQPGPPQQAPTGGVGPDGKTPPNTIGLPTRLPPQQPLNITQNLSPGMSGAEVKQLQDWLIAQGYAIPAGSTGYYGDQTKAAVAAWQKANNINTQGNDGYFGPISRAFVTSGGATGGSGGAGGTGGTGGGATGGAGGGTGGGQAGAVGGGSGNPPALTADKIAALKFLGWTDQQIQSANPNDAANWAMIGDYLKKQADAQGQLGQINAQKLQEAYNFALNDPDIAKKYADIQKVDQYNFNQQLQSLQSSATLQSQQQQAEYEQAQKDAADAAASAGQIYSGFRKQAQNKLDTQQSGIVTSSRQRLKDTLSGLASGLQSKYGSSQFSTLFPGMSVNYGGTSINPDLIQGDIMGSLALQKKQDIYNRQQQIYQGLQMPT